MRDRQPSAAGLAASGSDDAGPYSPGRDPTIIVLALIAVGSFLLLVAGVGTPLSGSGGGGPVFPIGDTDDGPREVDLSVSANRSTLSANGSVAVTVTDAGGDPVANATVSGGDARARTDADGRATLRLREAGTVTISADKAGDNETTYREAAVRVTVERVPVGLELSTNVSTARVGDPVAVELVRADTGAPVDGRLTVGNRTVSVTDGRATVRFDAAGEVALRANRSATTTERFRAATATVTVERRRAALEVWVADETLLVDEATLVRVRRSDTGEGVAAAVDVAGRTVETSDSGYAVLSGLSAGEYELRASAAPTPRVAFEEGTARLTVERETVPLAVTTNVTGPAGGEPVSVLVTRTDTGAPVNGTVTVDGRTYRTGDDGRVVLSFDRPGNRTLGVSKARTRAERFQDARTTVDVRAPWFEVDGDLTTTARVGGSYAETVTVRNTGNEPGETYVAYRLAGRTLANRTVSLAPGESVTVAFGPYLAPPITATYDHRVTVRTDAATGRLIVGNATAESGETGADDDAGASDARRYESDLQR